MFMVLTLWPNSAEEPLVFIFAAINKQYFFKDSSNLEAVHGW